MARAPASHSTHIWPHVSHYPIVCASQGEERSAGAGWGKRRPASSSWTVSPPVVRARGPTGLTHKNPWTWCDLAGKSRVRAGAALAVPPPNHHLSAVEYPLQLLHSPPAPVVKRPGAVGAHHSLQVITTSALPLFLSVIASSVPVSHHHCIPSVTTFPVISPVTMLLCPSVTMLPLPLSNVTAFPCHCVPFVMVYLLSLCPLSHLLCHCVFCQHVPSTTISCHVPCHCFPLSLSLLSLYPSVTMFPLPPYHLSLHPSCVPSATSLLSLYPSFTLEGLLGGVSASKLPGLPQEPPQPLNLTAKPKAPELPSTTSSPSLKMSSCGPRPPSHGAPTRDLQSSPPSLPLGKLLSRAWFFPSWGTHGRPLRVLA